MEMTEVTDVEPNYCSTHGENRIWVINGSHQIDGTDFTVKVLLLILPSRPFTMCTIKIRFLAEALHYGRLHQGGIRKCWHSDTRVCDVQIL